MRTRKSPQDSRLYNGIRRIDVSLPVEVVVALDRNIAEFGYFISRSSVIEVAIRQFLERGGISGASPGALAPTGN
ncbi:MAG TPA: ribbon-helix-helix protein, CopG family [Acidimicrobiia bacterium]|nr:ribbon-helix-helix protein, CopG family [Acidimicrobiia bacterium]